MTIDEKVLQELNRIKNIQTYHDLCMKKGEYKEVAELIIKIKNKEV